MLKALQTSFNLNESHFRTSCINTVSYRFCGFENFVNRNNLKYIIFGRFWHWFGNLPKSLIKGITHEYLYLPGKWYFNDTVHFYVDFKRKGNNDFKLNDFGKNTIVPCRWALLHIIKRPFLYLIELTSLFRITPVNFITSLIIYYTMSRFQMNFWYWKDWERYRGCGY